jgi:hypothetical protein
MEEKIKWFRDELHKFDMVNWADEYFAEACNGTNWLLDSKGGISFTDKEWNTAIELGDKKFF